MQRNYKFLNIITGWGVFLIALIVYLLTIEPTASFWDCGEFIASAYKLEVGHPPGAPLFMLLGRFFTIFAGGPENAAKMVNTLSATASAFTILFLFWSITHLVIRMMNKKYDELNFPEILAVLGSGLVGALAYTFSDTFWFSAVEAEVYATSSLFTAIVFWAILKWENESDKRKSQRWIILIAYLVGLSIGVHLLNLLAIPAIVFVYYFKKYEPSFKGLVEAVLLSLIILAAVMYGIIPGVPYLASRVELLFVNTAGLPFNSGLIFFIFLLACLVIWGIYYTHKKRKYVLNTIFLSFAVILIGYSSYATILIRSSANPPMDQNNPENIFNLIRYLNRDQYGDRPLFYGHYYNAPVTDREQGEPVYAREDGKYVVVDYTTKLKYDSRFTGLFPRMYSSESQHVKDYESWVDIKGKQLRVNNNQGKTEQRTVPSVGSNLAFFFKYQVGHMYFRYFMWNFSGRQNDIQGHGNVRDGNWITGISSFDNKRLGDQHLLPDNLKENPARNTYYMLPFLLGLLGFFYHSKKDPKNFFVILMLFIFTGIAIVYYLNQTPHQPRERDYAYAGSFYAFSIWIGFSVVAVFYSLKKIIKPLYAVLLAIFGLLFVPGLMAFENWDDHDRSGRYTTRDFAANYLNSCRPNAILFTNGDNDTFPLWYAQEVEGIRTDVRVSNLSYLRAGWYVQQMMRKAYESDPFPMVHEMKQMRRGSRDVVPVSDQIQGPVSLKSVVNFVASEDDRTKIPSPFERNKKIDYIPTRQFMLKIDSAHISDKGIIEPEYYPDIVDEMRWEVNRNYFMKDGLVVYDLLASHEWKRPVHFAITVGDNKHLNLGEYMLMEGLTHYLIPLETKPERTEKEINVNRMYDLLMNKFRWGGVDESDIYLNEDNRDMLLNFRSIFGKLSVALIEKGRLDSAEKVMDYALSKINNRTVAYEYTVVPYIRGYFEIGRNTKAKKELNTLMRNIEQEMYYYVSLGRVAPQFTDDIRRNMYVMRNLSDLCKENDEAALKEEIETKFSHYLEMLEDNIQLLR
ncbi:MAG: DUF2723 domain-containing protein [Bacteroidales bacterium]